MILKKKIAVFLTFDINLKNMTIKECELVKIILYRKIGFVFDLEGKNC